MYVTCIRSGCNGTHRRRWRQRGRKNKSCKSTEREDILRKKGFISPAAEPGLETEWGVSGWASWGENNIVQIIACFAFAFACFGRLLGGGEERKRSEKCTEARGEKWKLLLFSPFFLFSVSLFALVWLALGLSRYKKPIFPLWDKTFPCLFFLSFFIAIILNRPLGSRERKKERKNPSGKSRSSETNFLS